MGLHGNISHGGNSSCSNSNSQNSSNGDNNTAQKCNFSKKKMVKSYRCENK